MHTFTLKQKHQGEFGVQHLAHNASKCRLGELNSTTEISIDEPPTLRSSSHVHLNITIKIKSNLKLISITNFGMRIHSSSNTLHLSVFLEMN